MQQLLVVVSNETTSCRRKIGNVVAETPCPANDGSSVEVTKLSHQLTSNAPVLSPHHVLVPNSAAAADGTCTVCTGNVETFSLT